MCGMLIKFGKSKLSKSNLSTSNWSNSKWSKFQLRSFGTKTIYLFQLVVKKQNFYQIKHKSIAVSLAQLSPLLLSLFCSEFSYQRKIWFLTSDSDKMLIYDTHPKVRYFATKIQKKKIYINQTKKEKILPIQYSS